MLPMPEPSVSAVGAGSGGYVSGAAEGGTAPAWKNASPCDPRIASAKSTSPITNAGAIHSQARRLSGIPPGARSRGAGGGAGAGVDIVGVIHGGGVMLATVALKRRQEAPRAGCGDNARFAT